MAVRQGWLCVLLVLVAACGGITKGEHDLGNAAYFGDAGTVERLLAEGVDPNAVGETGRRFIVEAMLGGNREIMDVLYAAGSDPTLLSHGNSAFYYLALSSDDVSLAEWLLERGVDPCVPVEPIETVPADTLVEVAEDKGNDAMAEWLRTQTASC